MDFQIDPLIVELARDERKETFGIIICALFHRPKPISFVNFYQRLTKEFDKCLTKDERQAIYIYPTVYLHITIATLYNFKNPFPASTEQSLAFWKERFQVLKKTSQQRSFPLILDRIELSNAAAFFLYKDETNGIARIRRNIEQYCQADDGHEKLHIPGIIHTSFLRFIRKPNDPISFEEKFHRICREILADTEEIRFDIDEICLAVESHPYMHIDCDQSHVLDLMIC